MVKKNSEADSATVDFPRPPDRNFWKGKNHFERRSWFKGMFIDYPDAREVIIDVLDNIRYCMHALTSTGMHIAGESGAGKTTLINQIDRLVTAAYGRTDPEKTVKPVLRLGAPDPCTPPELCRSILEELGDPGARSRQSRDVKRSLQKITADMMNSCEVRVVLFDNFQDIPSARRARGIEQLGLRIRDLMDMTQCTWVFVGTEESKDVINAKSQLLKRVPYTKALPYFTLSNGGTKRFIRLLERYDEWLPLEQSNVEVLRNLSGFIFIATQGILDRLTRLLDSASYFAVIAGREELSKDDFKNAFGKVFGADHVNPFDEKFVPRLLNQSSEPYEQFGGLKRNETSTLTGRKQA